MTIFDTIRYPISDIPRPEQFEILPNKLYAAWIEENYLNEELSPAEMANVISQEILIGEYLDFHIDNINDLRKRIKDYDNI